ncbi:hypothetical protein [Xanthomonas arboricola]|uniref:Uncharacterized protein n=1 Tax=Xanthomonas arboricola pv. corylina TaxID=487821 RepID=A0A2S7C1X0_9XANT|nr:hypothetical protein [Xanthomonas arboricola]PPU55582.1 hypothetical protein XacyCFBP1159_21060 [Xanthomonas arboricola pv. corylina]CAE6754203.1 hypothetical protein CFBP1159_17560 [Xanthomonas arboricola pv. corylina]CAE6754225.1 hypothetical protein CFBP1159_17560 [Xanthomonas arboricola pv. corylina]
MLLKIGGTSLLDRVAKSAGYEHWHHVRLCLAETEAIEADRQLTKEIDRITAAAMAGEGKLILTGPEALASRQFVLFSTEDGDGWLLDPKEDRCLCLVWHGELQEVGVRDLPTRLVIEWDGAFRLRGPFFSVDTGHSQIRSRAIGGYPVDQLRDALERARSVDKRIEQIFGAEDGVALTPDIIDQLVGSGWDLEIVLKQAEQGAFYTPSRNSLLTPPRGRL